MNDNECDPGDPDEIEMMAATTRMQALGEKVLTAEVCAELILLAQNVLVICERRHRQAGRAG